MAKRKKRGTQQKQNQHPNQSKNQSSVSPQTVKNASEELKTAKESAAKHGVPVPRTASNSKEVEVTPADLNKAYTEALRAHETYDRVLESIDKKKSELEERESAITDKEKVAAEQLAIAEAKLTEANNLSNEASERTRDVLAREAKIEAGYAEKNLEAIKDLEETKNKILDAIQSTHVEHNDKVREVISETASQYAELSKLASEIQESVTKSVKSELTVMLEQIAEERKNYAETERMRAEIEIDRTILNEDREHFHAMLEQAYESRSAEDKATIERLNKAVKSKEEQIEKIGLEFAQLSAATAQYKDLSPEDTVVLIERLQGEVETLKLDSRLSPSEKEIARLKGIETHYNSLQDKYEELTMENTALKQSQVLSRKNVAELEMRQYEVDSQRQLAQLYRQQSDELRKEIDGLLDQSGSGTSFEQLNSIDNDPDYQSTPDLYEELGTLKDFTEDLRARLKFSSGKDGVELYYSIEDVRRFVAGLAMSKLHILQGISGTGKTSLARAFADSIGAGYELVPAQAGWRDRYDLIGHFNSFTKKYQETPFLKGLYEAQTPLYAGRPYIILIDEMNLSRVEHYFADILSLLEVGDTEKLLEIRWTPQGTHPQLFSDDLKHLTVPENVWFIGTANHDETTVEFADKTYDRSHVMELPSHPEPFKAKEPTHRPPISLETLEQLFRAAAKEFSEQAKHANDFLDSQLRKPMQASFGIGWGNRLHSHIATYVPVILACGGTLTEAVDHIIATKLLRKMRDRHDVLQSSISSMNNELSDAWNQLESNQLPMQSISLLENEEKKKGGLIK